MFNLRGHVAEQRAAYRRHLVESLSEVDRCHLAALYCNRFSQSVRRQLFKMTIPALAGCELFARKTYGY